MLSQLDRAEIVRLITTAQIETEKRFLEQFEKLRAETLALINSSTFDIRLTDKHLQQKR